MSVSVGGGKLGKLVLCICGISALVGLFVIANLPLAKFITGYSGPLVTRGILTFSLLGSGFCSGGDIAPSPGSGTGGVFCPGVDGIGFPACLYCPNPEYSDEARKAKYQGTVVIEAVIQPDGRATNIRVVKGLGLGLDQKAIEAVKKWRFKPAHGSGGTAVATINPIEVSFRMP